jgi:hypothetical protein
MHKGFKCLDVTSSCIYISRDMIFNESVCPFASMHATAGPLYHSEVLLDNPGNNKAANSTNAPAMLLLLVSDLVV